LTPGSTCPGPEVRSACNLDCGDRCLLLVSRTASGLQIRPDESDSWTNGLTCGKILRYPERLASPSRIREPQLKQADGIWRTASWEEAWTRIIPALEKALESDPASVLFLRGSGSLGRSKAHLDHVFRRLGARSTRGSLCDEAGIAALEQDWGSLDMNDPQEIDAAEAVVLWGKHPRACSTHTAAAVRRARRRGAPVIAVNPDSAAVAGLSTEVIRILPGADRFLALAVAKRLLEDDGFPQEADRLAGLREFRSLCRHWETGNLAEAAGCSEDEIELLARTYASTTRVATLVGWGLQRYLHGGENVRAIDTLCLIAGTIGREGGGLYYGLPSNRGFAPLPHAYPTPPEPLSLPRLGRELATRGAGIEFAWIAAANPVNQCPDSAAVAEGLAGVPTVVVVDAFWTDTARSASVVLPPALWLEEEDVVGSWWRKGLAAVRKATEPPAQCRTDWEITSELERRLGLEAHYPDLDSWLNASLPSECGGLDRLRRETWCELPHDPVVFRDGSAHADGRFRLLDSLSPPEPPEPPETPETPDLSGAERPLRLLSLIRREAMHSQILPENQRGWDSDDGLGLPMRMNPETARSRNLAPGDTVELEASDHRLTGRLLFDEGLVPGVVACPRDGWVQFGLGPNLLTADLTSDMGETAAFYETRVAVRAGSSEKARRSRPSSE